MPKELNPNHPVTQELRDQWHKVAALLMFKFGATEVAITTGDMVAFESSGRNNIAAHPSGNTLKLFLVGDDDAARMAKGAGGLPI